MRPSTVTALSAIGMLATSAAVLAVVPPPTPEWATSGVAAKARSAAPAVKIPSGNGVRCGATMCAAGEVCCGDEAPACVAADACIRGTSDGRIAAYVQHSCDEHSDCAGGEVCALLIAARGGGYSCQQAVHGIDGVVCTTSSDCRRGFSCQTSAVAPWMRSCAARAAPPSSTSSQRRGLASLGALGPRR